ncbi:MAG TPA: DEAD/DEAH box helicase [Nitrososphaeraceae archaeon]|nr:DEAD/DEAH box helicase [Nitrososphaeraceae archaeon]
MIVLHGIWGRAEDSKWYFYLWGETSVDDNDKASIIKQHFSFRHPFNASCEELRKVAKVASSFSTIEVILPTFKRQKKPQPSTTLLGQMEYRNQLLLNKWVVDCLVIDSADAIIYLKNIDEHLNNHNISYGDDLVYWSEVAKFSLDLIIRQRFVPSVKFSEHLLHDDNRRKYLATWIPIITDIKDSQRLKLLEDSMPPVCRVLNSRILPRQLLLNVLESLIDGSIRRFLQYGQEKIINEIVTKNMSDDYHAVDIEWLKALLSTDMEINSSEKSIENLVIELNRWSEAVSSHGEGRKFITCFRLEPPELDGGNGDNNNDRYNRNRTKWKLNYLLQAVDDPSLVIEADKIWKGFKGKKGKNEGIGKYLDRRFQHPQDRLLTDLAVASRLFKPIERSLKLPAPSGCLIDVNEANSFLTESVWLLRESGYVILLPSWWNDKQSSLGVTVTLKLKSKSKSLSGTTGMNLFGLNSLLDFDWRFAVGEDITITKAEFMKLVSLKSPIVNFRGQWINLRREYVESALKLLEQYKKNGGMPLGEVLSLMINRGRENFSQFKFEYHEKEIEEILSKLTSSDISLLDVLHQPDGFNGVLRDYQIRGYSWLHYLTCHGIGACLADDMGLGKTIQFIALLLSRRREHDTKPWILICPTSLVGNWIHEIKKFSPSVRLMVHHGASRLEGENFVHDAENHDLVISTYSLIQRDIETLSKKEWGVIALDEAQNIKNHYTKQSQTIKSLRSDMRIALTGTPIENRLSELWSIMDFLNSGYLYGIEEFRHRFSIPIERYRDTTKQTELQRLVKPFILRRVKTDPSIISDLPQKMEMKVYCSLTQEQATLYEVVVEQMMQNIEGSKGMKRKGMVLSALTRLKQICDHPSLYLADESANLDSRSGKLSRLKEMLEEIIEIGENSLVFTQYAGMGLMIKKYIQSSLGCETFFLHGSIPRKERDSMIKRFQEGSRTSDNKKSSRVFVLSIKAGGVGLNLTAANHVFHYDRWWNPAVENQATDRAYRIGQNKTVQIHKFISTGTLEEKIDEMIERKKGLAEGIIETGEKWITQMSNEQLRQIFTLRRDAVVKQK